MFLVLLQPAEFPLLQREDLFPGSFYNSEEITHYFHTDDREAFVDDYEQRGSHHNFGIPKDTDSLYISKSYDSHVYWDTGVFFLIFWAYFPSHLRVYSRGISRFLTGLVRGLLWKTYRSKKIIYHQYIGNLPYQK